MKNTLRIALPLIFLLSFGVLISQWGEQVPFDSPYLLNEIQTVAAKLRGFTGWVTNRKFQARGARAPRNKIIIVSIDTESIRKFGRWPWHRDKIAEILNRIGASGAKVIGVDLIAAERDPRVPERLKSDLNERHLGFLADRVETDPALIEAIRKNADRLVLGILSEGRCQPGFFEREQRACPTKDSQMTQAFEDGFGRFTISSFERPASFDFKKTPLFVFREPVFNFPEFQAAAQHIGSFDVELDPDGIMRQTTLIKFANETVLPSFALEIARLAMGEELKVVLGADSRLKSLSFAKSGRNIPVTPTGKMEINFRGPAHTFPYLSVADLMSDDERAPVLVNEKTGMPFHCESCQFIDRAIDDQHVRGMSVRKDELLKDAVVLLGGTTSLMDIKPIPFDNESPGVIGHAAIVDNLLSGDSFIPSSGGRDATILLVLVTLGALLFATAIAVLPASWSIPIKLPAGLEYTLPIPAGVGLAFGTLIALFYFDTRVLFLHQKNWNTGFLYLEYALIAVFILINKYILEEDRRKFLKLAFSRFVSPQVVKAIIDDPKKLELGGTKRDLTILFSDIRGFMPLCKRLDAQALLAFLKDYHEMATRIILERGTLDKYVGDNVMAFWGAPLEQKNHAANACRAAIQLMEALKLQNPKFLEKYGMTLGIGIGINSGPVTVGNIGSAQAVSYTAIGDDVNLASRVERLTRYYGVNILMTRATLDSIKQSGEVPPAHRILDRVKVIGSDRPVEIVQILDQAYPPTALESFQKARNLYGERRWSEAIAEFESAQNKIQSALSLNDGPCQVLIEQCRTFAATAPAPDWDGSWEMRSK